jgi:LuxR family maltose regulon positive regulatory protein
MTKLHPPPRREQTVARARLVERLRSPSGTKLTLLAAPPGSGKTTLLGTWREVEEATRPVAWLTLDEGDNDPVVLWSYVLAAFRRVCPSLRVPFSPNLVGPSLIVDVVLPELVNELTAIGEVALILDDFDRLTSGPARESIAWFIEHCPSGLQITIATRTEPPLPVAALRAHGALNELRADDLGFTPAEADMLLNGRLDLNLDPEDVDDLVVSTEGWPAGLYLAALSLQGAEDRHAFVSTFGGGSRHVVNFLVDEVLDAHDPATQDLMLRSSILDRLSGPICEAVVEQEGAGERLTELSRTNLFLVPLDDRDEWYRFHHLFAQLLRVELERREPGLAPTLHRRAYAWHRDHGSVEEAIRHALEAGAYADAAAIVSAVWFDIATVGRTATVLAWLERFPQEFTREEPRLLLAEAWLFLLTDRRDEAADAIEALEQLEWPDGVPLADGSSSLEASIATLRAAFPSGDVGAWYSHARRAVELQGPNSAFWAGACWPLGMACYYGGDFESADRCFSETVAVGLPRELWGLCASALAYRSFIAGERGQIGEQQWLAEDAAELAREHGLDERTGEVHAAFGASLAACGELEEALPFFARAISVLRSAGRSIELGDALIRRAAILQALNRPDFEDALEEARSVVDSCTDPGSLRTQVEALQRARPSRQEASLSERELVVLRMLSGSLSEREIGRELFLSHNTIHSHTKSIYRKLHVSSRVDAIGRARMLGLI